MSTSFRDVLTDCTHDPTPVDLDRASAGFGLKLLASMAPSCQDLKRPPADVVLNTILLVVLLVSYIPQVLRIYSKGATFGISLYYVAFAFLFTTCQLSNFLYLQCDRFPVLRCISQGAFSKLESYGAVLGLIQIAAIWTGSAIMLFFMTRYPIDTTSVSFKPAYQQLTSSEPVTILPESNRSFTTKTLITACMSFVLVLLIPAVIISLPHPADFDWGKAVYMAMSGFFAIPASLILVIMLFVPQVRLMWDLRNIPDSSCLSVVTLAIQMIAFMLLGISWIIRLGKLGTGYNTVQPVNSIYDYYLWYLWPYLNNMLFGGGQAILFFFWLYCKFGRPLTPDNSLEYGPSSPHEHAPLLRTL